MLYVRVSVRAYNDKPVGQNVDEDVCVERDDGRHVSGYRVGLADDGVKGESRLGRGMSVRRWAV